MPPAAETPDDAARLPALLREIFATQQVTRADGGRAPLTANISAPEAAVLYRCVRELRPERSLEIGYACGISGLAILQALEDAGRGEHVACDPFQADYDDIGLANAARAGLAHRLRFERKFADEVVPALPRLQFAFVDASHLFDWTLAEFVLIDRKLEVGGVIGFHDLWMPSLQKMIRYILGNRRYAVHPLTAARPAPEHPVKAAIRGVCRALPRSATTFAPEFLRPWRDYGLPNLVLLTKQAEDTRDWRFHATF